MGDLRDEALASALNLARRWAVENALPFWATAGFDDRLGSFHERVDFRGQPILAAPRRTMAQARQIYAFCHAAELGWFSPGAEKALKAADSLIRRHWQSDGAPGWVFSTGPDGQVCDARRDTYAHAFALLGLAWAYRLERQPRFRRIADETFCVLDTVLAASGGGFIDGVPRPDALRRQNPHMHLFEASLAWFEASGDERFLARAGEIFGLFRTRLFHVETGALGEYFDDGWDRAPGRLGTVCEPGHHFEWVWLLYRYERLSGRSVSSYAEALYDHAVTHGHGGNGLLYDEVDTSGLALKRSQRCWPHTEALKAVAARAERGIMAHPGRSHDAEAGRYLDCLMTHYLGRPFAGGWVDHLNEDGSAKVDFVPSSTLYHAFLAIAEADRVFGQRHDLTPGA